MINTLLDWMAGQGLRRASPLRAAGSSNPLSTGMSRDMDIRHLTLGQYLFLRDVGLGGQSLDGEVDRAFPGQAPTRSRAAADLALTSGMRSQDSDGALTPLPSSQHPQTTPSNLGLPSKRSRAEHHC
ncbi:hypothetical protein FB157_11124 [Streptomyces sp. BK340]|nr:hypothetical protein FB157_11124 [Streptomyces sp. BK340]